MTKWSGRTSAYAHKRDDWREHDVSGVRPGVKRAWVLHAQWTQCPVEVEDQVKLLWRHRELGNDNYAIFTNLKELREIEAKKTMIRDYSVGGKVPVKTDLIVEYLQEMGVGEDDEVVIHWWW